MFYEVKSFTKKLKTDVVLLVIAVFTAKILAIAAQNSIVTQPFLSTAQAHFSFQKHQLLVKVLDLS